MLYSKLNAKEIELLILMNWGEAWWKFRSRSFLFNKFSLPFGCLINGKLNEMETRKLLLQRIKLFHVPPSSSEEEKILSCAKELFIGKLFSIFSYWMILHSLHILYHAQSLHSLFQKTSLLAGGNLASYIIAFDILIKYKSARKRVERNFIRYNTKRCMSFRSWSWSVSTSYNKVAIEYRNKYFTKMKITSHF